MKKIFPIALVLAVVTTLCFGSVALADGPPEVTVNFNVTDPDITVTAYKANNMANDWAWEGTAQFTLTGASSATGSVTADFNGVFECYTDITGQPQVFGEYTASGGDFQSTFSAYSYETDSGYYEMAAWSTHSVDATGVTSSSMTVNGAAIAAYGSGGHFGGFVEGWQTYTGEAEEVEVFGSKMHSNRQPVGGPWDLDKLTGAEFTATATASSTLSFGGGTEAGTYYQGWETSPYQVLAKQGLGFEVYTTGTSLATVWNSNYAYNVIDAFVNPDGPGVVGESSTALVGWTGIPGYISP